ncbi:dihydrodipicolinate synthase family protein [candidate division KSB1 bacterium]|nr:dihydrodipicolinate synthase family protein [candidate division KSB1 bacterium]
MSGKFTGIFPALTTPFEQGQLSIGKLEKNIEQYNKYDFSGYLVLGSTGETILLDDSERLSLVKTMCTLTPEGKKVIAGTGRESTAATIEFTNKAAESGADAALVVTPSYYSGLMSAEVLVDYYLEIAENTDISILLYNVPKYTGLNLPLETISRTMRHPNIDGIKDSSGNMSYLEEIINMNSDSDDFSILQGSGSVLFASLMLGADGGVLALSDFAPRETTAIFEEFKKGDLDKCQKIQLKITPVNNKIVGSFGVPGIKYALDLLGFFGGDPRQPLKPSNKEVKEEIEKILSGAGML